MQAWRRATYTTNSQRQKPTKTIVTPTSASRKRISDLRLPFLIEPGRELSTDPTSTKGGWWIISLTVRGIGPAVELIYYMIIRTPSRVWTPRKLTSRYSSPCLITSEISPQRSPSKQKYHHTNLAACAPHLSSSSGDRKSRQPSGPCVRLGAPVKCWRYPGGGGAAHATVVSHHRSDHSVIQGVSYTFEHLRERTAATISVAKDKQ